MSKLNNTQLKLNTLYTEWKQTFDQSNVDIASFSPPLLLSASDTFANSAKKAVVFGQETFGWSWTKENVAETGGYPEFSFKNLNSLSDFLANDDSVAALCWAYEKFDFAKHQPNNFRSPFWRAFRELQRVSGCEFIWTNCIKCDFQRWHPSAIASIRSRRVHCPAK